MVCAGNSLTHLTLDAFPASYRSLKDPILGMILRNLQLVHLSLKNNKLKDLGCTLGRYLSQSKTLETLDVSGTHLCAKAIESICRALSTEQHRMKNLHMARIQELSFEGVYEIGRMLETNQTLRVLDLSRNYQAMTQGIIVIMGRLEKNANLQCLKVNNIVASDCTF